MKILLVTEYYWPHIGGVEVVFKHLAEGLVAKGHEVYVVTSRVPDTERYEELNGVKIRRINVPKMGDRYFFTFLSIPWVWRLAKKCHVVHTTLYNAAFPAWLVGKLRGRPAVITVHEIFGKKWGQRFDSNPLWSTMHRIFERTLLMFNFKKYICVSHATANDLSQIKDSDDIQVIHNGIDQNHFNPSQYDRKKFRTKLKLKPKNFAYLYYGRPGLSKGVEYLVRAFARVQPELPHSKLVLILSQKPKKRYLMIKKLIRDLELKDHVILKKSVPYKDLPGYIKAADTVVVPSLAEGFGFAAAESSAMNVPVVVSNTSSLPEVAHGRVVFAKPKDSKSLAQAMLKAKQGKFKKVATKDFNWKTNVKDHLKLYKDVCKKD
jgi:glycosyltransferase involved in cell wall biosynthesis